MSVDVEQAVLGTVLLHPDQWPTASRRLVVTDFAGPTHRVLWAILDRLHHAGPVDVPLVLDAVAADGDAGEVVLDLLRAELPSVGLLERHVVRVLEHAARRRLTDVIAQASLDLADGAEAAPVVDTLRAALGHVVIPDGPLPDDYLTATAVEKFATATPVPWVIPNLLRRGARAVLVAPEGIGKSVLGRQLAVAPAAGLHPFATGSRIPPVRVLVLDFENDHRAVHRADGKVDTTALAAMIARARRLNPAWKPDDSLSVWSRPRGINVRDRADLATLRAVVAVAAPDLVIAGPVYRMSSRTGRETDEELASATTDVLDDLRATHKFAIVLEAHAPHGSFGSRDLRPVGSSVWLRWPDLGRTFTAAKRPGVLEVGRFRGDRFPVHWPDELHRARPGDPWPWVGIHLNRPPAPAPNLFDTVSDETTTTPSENP